MVQKRGFVLFIAALSVFILASVSAQGAKREPVESPQEDENILVQGVPGEFQPLLAEWLNKQRVKFRFESKTRAFYVKSDPIPILKAAKGVESIASLARRGLYERELEKEFRVRWPEVKDPRVCLAYPDGIRGREADAEPAAFIMAQGLSREDKEQLSQLIAERVPGLPARNIVVMGTSWRPRPSYEEADRGNTKVAQAQEDASARRTPR
jgi:hypothetical protein